MTTTETTEGTETKKAKSSGRRPSLAEWLAKHQLPAEMAENMSRADRALALAVDADLKELDRREASLKLATDRVETLAHEVAALSDVRDQLDALLTKLRG